MSLRSWSCCCYCFLPLLLSDTATLVENNGKNDINDPYCVQCEGNPLEKGLGGPALSCYVVLFPSSSLLFFFVFRAYKRFYNQSLFQNFLWSLYFAQPLLLLFSFFYVNHNVFFAHSLSVLSQTFNTKTQPPLSHFFSLHLRLI